MSLIKAINKAIEKNIDKFVEEIEHKYGVSKTDLLDMWMDISKMKMKTQNKNKKLSPWLQFCKDQRIIMKKNHPEMSFGEISKMIGFEWSKMTKDEKNTYKKIEEPEMKVVEEEEDLMKVVEKEEEDLMKVVDEEDETMMKVTEEEEDLMKVVDEEDVMKVTKETMKVVDDEDETMKVVDIVEEGTVKVAEDGIAEEEEDDMNHMSEKLKGYEIHDLKKMKISQLKDMCKGLLLSKTGKKEDLVARLINYKNSPSHSDSDDENFNSDDE